MLEKILGSELKIKMIDFFLSQEENKVFSYSDISNSLNLKGSIWRRDLNDLLDINLLKQSRSL